MIEGVMSGTEFFRSIARGWNVEQFPQPTSPPERQGVRAVVCVA